MKMPFYTVLGSVLKRHQKEISKVCAHPALKLAPIYVGILGTLGVILSLYDIIRIIRCGPVLPGYLWRERLKTGTVVTPEAERDCKLICLVLSSEYYLFLLFGLSTNNPVFFMPFLLLYALIIVMESLIFFVRTFVEGVEFRKCGLIMSLLLIFNWMSVFCTFCRTTTTCDV